MSGDPTEKDLEISAIIREEMAPHGWRGAHFAANPFSLGVLTVESAVGFKDGTAYWSRSRDDATYSIRGTFMSEGRNVCAVPVATFPEDAGRDRIADAVNGFCAEFRKRVNESYAVRLFLRRGAPEVAEMDGILRAASPDEDESAGPR